MSANSRPLAVVTGASSGIGLALAREFAHHQFDLVVAADDSAVYDVAQRISLDGVTVRAVQEDLATEQGVRRLWNAVRAWKKPIEAAALNGGIALNGRFASDTELPVELRVIDVNVRSSVYLAKLALTDMARNGHGRLLLTSSVEAVLPGTNQAVYAASQAFLNSFGDALRAELRGTGVTVTTLLPRPTDTPIFEKLGAATIFGAAPKSSPETVARQAFEGLMRGDDHVIAGSMVDRLIVRTAQALPDSAKAAIQAWMARSRPPQEVAASRVLRGINVTAASAQRAAAEGRRLVSSPPSVGVARLADLARRRSRGDAVGDDWAT